PVPRARHALRIRGETQRDQVRCRELLGGLLANPQTEILAPELAESAMRYHVRPRVNEMEVAHQEMKGRRRQSGHPSFHDARLGPPCGSQERGSAPASEKRSEDARVGLLPLLLGQ